MQTAVRIEGIYHVFSNSGIAARFRDIQASVLELDTHARIKVGEVIFTTFLWQEFQNQQQATRSISFTQVSFNDSNRCHK
jgi:hypothetical protein